MGNMDIKVKESIYIQCNGHEYMVRPNDFLNKLKKDILNFWFIRFENYTSPLAAVDCDRKRTIEAHNPQPLGFIYGRHGVEVVDIIQAVVAEGIDSEISNAERGKVVEEMSALTGLNAIICQGGFDNQASAGDVGPFDRDAESGVA